MDAPKEEYYKFRSANEILYSCKYIGEFGYAAQEGTGIIEHSIILFEFFLSLKGLLIALKEFKHDVDLLTTQRAFDLVIYVFIKRKDALQTERMTASGSYRPTFRLYEAY
jgi:hypothetical protein